MRNKHKNFAREYILDCNGKQAAIRAGYTPDCAERTAYRLLNIPDIASYIKELQHKATERAEVTEDFVIQTLLTVISKGLGHEDTNTLVKEGFGAGISQVDSRKLKKDDLTAVKGAAELLGRYKGMFTDKVDLKHSGQILKRIINVNPTSKGK